ncbi:MAG: hypothetical protein GWO02_10360 [Gammaproteobacteria bacterium]|nr:hypothetical protein [Gammaproteobacteria bacterium]
MAHKAASGRSSMIEPVALKDFFLAFFSSALVVCAGAMCALLLAFGRLRGSI